MRQFPRFRYRIQYKEPWAMPNILGNCSFPVHTYRWVDVMLCEDLETAKSILDAKSPKEREKYRIEDVEEGKVYR